MTSLSHDRHREDECLGTSQLSQPDVEYLFDFLTSWTDKGTSFDRQAPSGKTKRVFHP